jgi:hypothetical protein
MFQSTGPVQSAYVRYAPVGMAGMIAAETPYDIDTKVFEENASPVAGVGFGVAVFQGVADRGARIGGSGVFLGITCANPTQPVHSFTDKYSGGDSIPVLTKGDIWITAEAAVVAGEALYVNAATGALAHSGGTAVHNARWMTSALAGQLAVLRLGALSVG